VGAAGQGAEAGGVDPCDGRHTEESSHRGSQWRIRWAATRPWTTGRGRRSRGRRWGRAAAVGLEQQRWEARWEGGEGWPADRCTGDGGWGGKGKRGSGTKLECETLTLTRVGSCIYRQVVGLGPLHRGIIVITRG
jgi:hypothetical protein